MNIIGLSGAAGSGKDTVADILVTRHGFVKVALADPMKRIAKEVFPALSYEDLWGPSERRARPLGVTTLRDALQRLGTEWGRSIDENVWIDCALRAAEKLLGQGRCGYLGNLGVYTDIFSGQPCGVVVPDVRFPNELAAIRKAGGVVWQVVRPGSGLAGAAAKHVSETSMPADADWSSTALNDDSLQVLEARVAALMHNGRPI